MTNQNNSHKVYEDEEWDEETQKNWDEKMSEPIKIVLLEE